MSKIKLSYHGGTPGNWYVGFKIDSTGYEYITWDKVVYQEVIQLAHFQPGRALNRAKKQMSLTGKKENVNA